MDLLDSIKELLFRADEDSLICASSIGSNGFFIKKSAFTRPVLDRDE